MANYQNIIPTKLGQAALTTSYVTLYTVPSTPATRTIVKEFDIINTTNATVYVYVSFVPANGTANTTNAIMYNNALPAYTTVQWCGSTVLNSEDFISVKASAVGCTITISGGEGT